MPVTICAATRPESPVVVEKAKEAIVKTADPRQTKIIVRNPAGFSRRCRSPPTTAPQTTDTSASTTESHGEEINNRQFSKSRFTTSKF